MNEQLEKQFEITRKNLKPDALVIDGLIQITELMEMMFKYLEKQKNNDHN